MNQELLLYGTTGCHLCDEAEKILGQLAAARSFHWRYVDIALDEALVEKYGVRIPVLKAPNGQELGWPFSVLDAMRLLP